MEFVCCPVAYLSLTTRGPSAALSDQAFVGRRCSLCNWLRYIVSWAQPAFVITPVFQVMFSNVGGVVWVLLPQKGSDLRQSRGCIWSWLGVL